VIGAKVFTYPHSTASNFCLIQTDENALTEMLLQNSVYKQQQSR
jgi:hypothetical protein